MKNEGLNPIKEKVNPHDLYKIVEGFTYSKPNWMLNESIYDATWKVAKVGTELYRYENTKIKPLKISFRKKVASNEYLTDKINHSLLLDIQHSFIYLYTIGKITRPMRFGEILLSITKLIRHANELRQNNKSQPIRNLSQINIEDLKSYFNCYNIEEGIFSDLIIHITENYKSKSEINWKEIRTKFFFSSKKLSIIKHKAMDYFKSEGTTFQPESAYRREFPNANKVIFDINYSLTPKESTISNEISKLEALYTSRTSQKYKFKHSVMQLFSSGTALFDDMQKREKTSLMPISLLLNNISSALHFVRNYGKPLRQYLSELNKKESERINEIGIMVSTSRRSNLSIKMYAYENTEIPEELKSLKINSWIKNDTSAQEDYSQLRNGMSVGMAVRLYTAAIWILIASFTAARSTSLLTLKRSCFVQSPIDNLFDIILKIPKSSERLELEDVHRPIPDLIYDYGLEFASLACELEERRGFIGDDSDQFLFGSILSYRSVSAAREDGGISLVKSLKQDYIDSSIDMFMDWSESPLIGGERWYPRTHQFRRAFCVIYFNFSDQLGLDELSWFVGHSNLDHTFHYAEISPDDDWIDEAEATISRIASSLKDAINGDDTIKNIVSEARKRSSVSIILEPLVRNLIEQHKNKTGQQVRFHKISGNQIFFYFTDSED